MINPPVLGQFGYIRKDKKIGNCRYTFLEKKLSKTTDQFWWVNQR
jgi:hypothetical protein